MSSIDNVAYWVKVPTPPLASGIAALFWNEKAHTYRWETQGEGKEYWKLWDSHAHSLEYKLTPYSPIPRPSFGILRIEEDSYTPGTELGVIKCLAFLMADKRALSVPSWTLLKENTQRKALEGMKKRFYSKEGHLTIHRMLIDTGLASYCRYPGCISSHDQGCGLCRYHIFLRKQTMDSIKRAKVVSPDLVEIVSGYLY
jgi:hypothetical protein